MNKDTGIDIKLRKKHIILNVEEETETKRVVNMLKRKLPEIKELYKDVTPQISVMGKSFKHKELYEIEKTFNKFFDVDVNFECSKMLGLYGIRKPFNKEIATSETKFYRSSLRSGQKVEFEGSIVVLGDVNGGAEVIAGENVVVLGTIRGMVHAGAKGNKEAIISAGSIEASQIRISNIIKECEWDDATDNIIKTNAYVADDDSIVIE